MTTTRAFVPALTALTLIALTLGAPVRGFADNAPVAPNGVLELEGHTSIVLQSGGFDFLADLTGRLEDAGLTFQYRALTLGGYYRLLKNLKVGAFYRLQAGVRHDDDWGSNPTPLPWSWAATAGRLENELMADVSPRFLLDFLPGRSWVLMLKGRYIYNTFENQQSIMVRPELTFFWLVDRQPLLDFQAAYEIYFPLNFGGTAIYESYPWLGVHYHL
ncbi:MAG TPA: hypothetical protein VMM82_05685, partial [Spirochaetia bacterium]|nr:hypothetical protein [Spirochaetia bacterium]